MRLQAYGPGIISWPHPHPRVHRWIDSDGTIWAAMTYELGRDPDWIEFVWWS